MIMRVEMITLTGVVGVRSNSRKPLPPTLEMPPLRPVVVVLVVLAAAEAAWDVVARLVEDFADGLKSLVVEVVKKVYC